MSTDLQLWMQEGHLKVCRLWEYIKISNISLLLCVSENNYSTFTYCVLLTLCITVLLYALWQFKIYSVLCNSCGTIKSWSNKKRKKIIQIGTMYKFSTTTTVQAFSVWICIVREYCNIVKSTFKWLWQEIKYEMKTGGASATHNTSPRLHSNQKDLLCMITFLRELLGL